VAFGKVPSVTNGPHMSLSQPFFLLTLQGTWDGRMQASLEKKVSPAAGEGGLVGHKGGRGLGSSWWSTTEAHRLGPLRPAAAGAALSSCPAVKVARDEGLWGHRSSPRPCREELARALAEAVAAPALGRVGAVSQSAPPPELRGAKADQWEATTSQEAAGDAPLSQIAGQGHSDLVLAGARRDGVAQLELEQTGSPQKIERGSPNQGTTLAYRMRGERTRRQPTHERHNRSADLE
jgi:hypothetical protein